MFLLIDDDKFVCRYVECDGQTVLQYLIELEEKNLVKHLDHDGQQWTRVIIAEQEDDTHSSLNYYTVFFSFKQNSLLFDRSHSLQIDLGTISFIPSDDCHYNSELFRKISSRCHDRKQGYIRSTS